MANWPDANNTGVPDGVTLMPSGGMTITKDGTVIDGLAVHGMIYVAADNVTIKNSSITSSDYAAIVIPRGVTGTTVQDCEIDGLNAGGQGISGAGTFLRNDIHNVADGINVAGNDVLIQDNYIHDLGGTADSHYDGIQVDGGVDGMRIEHNTVINDFGQTSAIMIDDEFGPISDVVVNNNILSGGGYTIYVTGDNGNGTHGVSVTNNHMGEGKYGYTDFVSTNPVYTGNINDGHDMVASLGQQSGTDGSDTGAAVDTGTSVDAGAGTDSGTDTHTGSDSGSTDTGSTDTGSHAGAGTGTSGGTDTGTSDGSGSTSTDGGDTGTDGGTSTGGTSDDSGHAGWWGGHGHWGHGNDHFHFDRTAASTGQSADTGASNSGGHAWHVQQPAETDTTASTATADDATAGCHAYTEWGGHHDFMQGHHFFM